MCGPISINGRPYGYRQADAEQEKHTGGMIALYPRSDFAQMLAVPGGEPIEELHVTLVFLGDNVGYQSPDPLARACHQISDSYGEIAAEIFAHAVFNPDGNGGKDPCGVYLVGHASDLTKIHEDAIQAAEQAFPIPEQHDPWIPHLTAGYASQDGAAQVGEYTGQVIFDRLGLAFAGQTQFFPFHGAAMVAASLSLFPRYLR